MSSNDVVKGNILFYNTAAHILFNSGFKHSFISEYFVNTLELPVKKLEEKYIS